MIRSLCAAVLLVALSACGLDPAPPLIIACPPLDDPLTPGEAPDFRDVSSLLENRCGSLDCHGSLYRPLRIYGKDGLRMFSDEQYADPGVAQDAGIVSGGEATSTEELELNRRSICGLEPEKMTPVLNGELDPTELLILQKALGDVNCDGREDDGCARHKGGNVFVGKGAVDTACVASWLRGGPVDTAACSEAVLVD